MVSATPSLFSLIAAAFYIVVAGAAAMAMARANALQQVAWHKLGWLAIATLFVIFAVMRIFAVEELVRNDLRITLYNQGSYELRRSLQGPLFAAVFIIAAITAAGLFYFTARGVRGRRNIAVLTAVGCTGGMLFLAALRLVSLHSVDQLLYGPLKLNWLADLGLSLAVLAFALRYRMVVRTTHV